VLACKSVLLRCQRLFYLLEFVRIAKSVVWCREQISETYVFGSGLSFAEFGVSFVVLTSQSSAHVLSYEIVQHFFYFVLCLAFKNQVNLSSKIDFIFINRLGGQWDTGILGPSFSRSIALTTGTRSAHSLQFERILNRACLHLNYRCFFVGPTRNHAAEICVPESTFFELFEGRLAR
jgi:hypothetical protein